MPVEQRRVTVDRSLATSEQENPSIAKVMPRSGRRYDEPHTNAPSSRTGSRPGQRDPQRRTTASQPTRRTGDAQLRLPADDGREFYDYGSATDQLTLLPLNRQPPRTRTTSAYPTTTAQTRSSGPTTRQKSIQDPVTQPAIHRVNWWSRRSWQTQVALVMFGILLLWTLGVNAYTGFVASISDPISYTQLAHRDSAVVLVHGLALPVHAFINTATSHLELLIVPTDVSKSVVIEGPQLYGTNPQQLMTAISVHGTQVTVNAIAGRDVIDFVAPRQSIVSWTVDLAQKRGK